MLFLHFEEPLGRISPHLLVRLAIPSEMLRLVAFGSFMMASASISNQNSFGQVWLLDLKVKQFSECWLQ